jgi:hypothetical protein
MIRISLRNELLLRRLAVLVDDPSSCLQTLAGSRRRKTGDNDVAHGTLRVFPLGKRRYRLGPDDIVGIGIGSTDGSVAASRPGALTIRPRACIRRNHITNLPYALYEALPHRDDHARTWTCTLAQDAESLPERAMQAPTETAHAAVTKQ